MILWIILGIIVVLVFYVIMAYNSLVQVKNKVKANWSNIEVQMKRRADLIPNLVNTVKGYAAHEKATLEEVIRARNQFVQANTPEDQMKADGELTQALSRLMVVAEAYPDLKANSNFTELQNELSQTENKIAIARQIYNDSVYTYNNATEMFPKSFIASIFNFPSFTMFEAEEKDREVPKVEF